MRAHSAARSRGTASRTLRTADMVPRAKASSQSASSRSSNRPAPGPMVWTRTFSEPQRSPTSRKPAAMDAGSVMSTLMPTASGLPRDRRAATVSSRASRPRAMTATRAPSVARTSATARPIPLLPPVTTAVASANPRSTSVHLLRLRRAAVPGDAGVIGRTACSRRAGAPPWWRGRSSGVTRRVPAGTDCCDVGELDQPRGRHGRRLGADAAQNDRARRCARRCRASWRRPGPRGR